MTQVFQHDARKGRLRAVLPSLLMVQPVVAWAAFGAAVFIFSLTGFGRWLVSPEFSPVPVVNNDGFDAPAVLMLRMFEALSLSVAASALGHYLLRPLLLRRPVPIEGLLLAAPLVTYVFDTTVNYNDYFMAWNAHSINAGTWANYFPGHHGPTRYAEGLA